VYNYLESRTSAQDKLFTNFTFPLEPLYKFSLSYKELGNGI